MDACDIWKFLAGGSGEASTVAADVVWTARGGGHPDQWVIHELYWMRSVFG
jgi:hypothetical protein